MLVTTFKSKELSQFGSFYYQKSESEQKIQNNDNLFLFKGYLYPDLKEKVENLFTFLAIRGLDKNIKRFKGRYCGCLINKKDNSVIIFNDQLGLYDIFYHFEDGDLIVGDKFTDFFSIRQFSRNDLDIVAMAEFLLYEHVLSNRTFLKNVGLLPIASVKNFELNSNNSSMITFWEYRFKTQELFDKKEAFEKVDGLFKQSMKRIVMLNPGKTFMIGLSGGYDSRLAAQYALDEGVNLNPFVYNHRESDAYHISKKLAQLMGLSLKKVEIQDNYFSLKDIHMQYNPMHNIMYTTYGTVINDLPDADVMLSGFLGGELFGTHIKPWDTDPRMSVVEKMKKRLARFKTEPVISKRIEEGISGDLSRYEKIEAEDWQRCEIFTYENRERRFIKDSPNLNFYGRHEQYHSIFADIDLIEYVTTFPYDELAQKRFYFDFFKHSFPDLSKIRGERQAYTLYDHPSVKKMKSDALKFKYRLLKKYGVRLPIFKTINYLGHFDWNDLFKKSRFDEEFKDIKIKGIDSQKIKEIDNRYSSLKFLYLTLQFFIYKFIENIDIQEQKKSTSNESKRKYDKTQ